MHEKYVLYNKVFLYLFSCIISLSSALVIFRLSLYSSWIHVSSSGILTSPSLYSLTPVQHLSSCAPFPCLCGGGAVWQTPMGSDWKYFKTIAVNKRELAECLLAVRVHYYKEKNSYFQIIKQTKRQGKKGNMRNSYK